METIITAIKQSLKENENITFQKNHELIGQSGKLHKIDFSYRMLIGKTEHLVIFDLTHLHDEITSVEVNKLYEIMIDCGASNAVLASTVFFRLDTIEAAIKNGVPLMIIKDVDSRFNSFTALNTKSLKYTGTKPIHHVYFRSIQINYDQYFEARLPKKLWKFYSTADFSIFFVRIISQSIGPFINFRRTKNNSINNS